MRKIRVWCVLRGVDDIFYVPVKTPEEGKKVTDMLTAYDAFQVKNNVLDYPNAFGLEMYDEEKKEWCNWQMEEEGKLYKNVDEYCAQCEKAEELEEFKRELYQQID